MFCCELFKIPNDQGVLSDEESQEKLSSGTPPQLELRLSMENEGLMSGGLAEDG